ncbi:MAG: glycosyltransferase family 39 protein [Desulfobacterales bacterium]
MVYLNRLLGTLGILGLIWISGSPFHPAVVARPWILAAGLIPAALLAFWRPSAALRQWGYRMVFESPKRAFNLALFAAGALLYSGLCWVLFQGIPHMDDAVAALFSAQLFSMGQFTWPLPPEPEFFKVFGVLSATENRPYLVGMYPPGWSALLAGGVLIKAPWLVNPLLGGGLAVAISELGESLYDRQVGRLAGILLLLSPFVGLISATHLSHTATALGVVLAWWAVWRMIESEKWIYGAVAGCAMGMALLCRPATAFIAGIAIALVFVPKFRSLGRIWPGALLAMALVFISAGVLAGYQQVATGNWRTPGHNVEMGPFAKLGFVQITGRWHHTPRTGAQFSGMRLTALNQHLLGWPLLSLPLALVPLVLGRARFREYWLLAPFGFLVLFFSAFWYFEVYYPGRYLFAGVPLLFLLIAAGLVQLARLPNPESKWRRLPEFIAIAGILFSVSTGNMALFKTISPHHGDVESVLPQVVRHYKITNAVVFINARGLWDRPWNRQNDYYATGFQMNDLALQGDVIYARDLGPDNLRLMRRYPGRRYYLYYFDRQRHQGLLYQARPPVDQQITYTPVEPKDHWLYSDGQPLVVEIGNSPN